MLQRLRGFWRALGSGLMMCACAHSFAQTYISSSSTELPLSFFTDRGVSDRGVGISVAVLDTRENPNVVRWLGHRPGEPMNPASTEKLITTRAAWSILGPNYRHRTRFLTTGTVRNGRLKGSVYVKGGGDPKLVQEDLQAIVSELRAAGIQHIEGDLVLDGTRFGEPPGDPNAFDGMGFKPYNVTPHAAMLNFKAVKVILSRSANGRLKGEIEPALTGLRLRTAVRQVRGDCSRNQIQVITKTNLLEVQGRLGKGCPGVELYVSVYDHLQFAHRLFSATWRAAGGRFQGRVREGRTPAPARLLLEWVSPRPLQELIADINKLSNNPMARTLYLNLSAETGGPGTRADAEQRIRSWLSGQNLAFPELVIDNGSGLSRASRIAPQSLTRLLVEALRGPGAAEWIETLPAAGLEGTMRRRLRDGAVLGRAWVKTGSLENVRAYSGYALTEAGHWVAFSAIINDPKAREAAPGLEALVKWIVETL